MRNTIRYILPAFALFGLIAGCAKSYDSIETVDKQNITAYLQKNGLSLQEDEATGVYYKVTKTATGPDLDYGKQIPILFTAKTLDGKYSIQDTFASTNRFGKFFGYFTLANGGQPEALRNAIKSFLKKENGEIRVIVPSRLAYGKDGYSSFGIDGNQSIDYSVKVLTTSDLDKYDDYQITKYMTANSLTGYTKTSDGIYYKISDVGTGSQITKDSIITAVYTGKLLNGTVFDQATTSSPANLGYLYGLLPAWTKIIPLIREGGSVRFIIPSRQGYGIVGTPQYANFAFSCMDFEVKVTDVSP